MLCVVGSVICDHRLQFHTSDDPEINIMIIVSIMHYVSPRMFLVGSDCSGRLSSFVGCSFRVVLLENPVLVAALEPLMAGDALLSGAFSEPGTILRRPAAAQSEPETILRRPAATQKRPATAMNSLCRKRLSTKRRAAESVEQKTSIRKRTPKKVEAAKAVDGVTLETADEDIADAAGVGYEEMIPRDQEDAEEEEEI